MWASIIRLNLFCTRCRFRTCMKSCHSMYSNTCIENNVGGESCYHGVNQIRWVWSNRHSISLPLYHWRPFGLGWLTVTVWRESLVESALLAMCFAEEWHTLLMRIAHICLFHTLAKHHHHQSIFLRFLVLQLSARIQIIHHTFLPHAEETRKHCIRAYSSIKHSLSIPYTHTSSFK